MVKRKAVTAVILSCAVIFIVAGIIWKQQKTVFQADLVKSDSGDIANRPRTEEVQSGEETDRPTGRGLTALEKAAKEEKYLFVFFYKGNVKIARSMREEFEASMSSVLEMADSISIDVTLPQEKGIIDKFGLSRAPMPLVLAIAPNGAVTGAFPRQFTSSQFSESILSPCAERSLKALQERKLVFLCFQNEKTTQNDAAMRGVMEFKADVRFAQATEIIKADPAIEEELEYLRKMKIDYTKGEALTVFMVPPGKIIGTYRGATDKATMEKMLLSVMSSCGTGCAPSGCGPK